MFIVAASLPLVTLELETPCVCWLRKLGEGKVDTMVLAVATADVVAAVTPTVVETQD